MSKDFDVVLLGSDMNTYGFARSLYEEYGIVSNSISKMQLRYVKHSKIIKFHIIENFENEKIFVHSLLQLREQLEAKNVLLIACGDTYVDKILENKDILQEKYILPYIDKELADKLQDKASFYNLCEKYGLSYPKTEVVDKDNYSNVEINLDFPVVLKAANSVMYWQTSFPGRKKVFFAKDKTQLNEILALVYNSDYSDKFIIQEYIPGDDSYNAVINNYSTKKGKVVMQAFGRVLLEDHAPNAMGCHMAILTQDNNEIAEKVKMLLEEVGYVGYSNFDLKYDIRDNTYKFFEINLRQGRSSFYVTSAGCNLAKFVVDDYIYNKKIKYQLTKTDSVWSVVPKSVIKKYIKDSEIYGKYLKVIKKDGSCNSLIYNKDLSIKRLISQNRDFFMQRLRYKKHGNGKGKDIE